MLQRIELKDNMGNRGVLEFDVSVDEKIASKQEITLTAMEFSRMVGILETLGDVKENCFEKHKADILKWAKEFVESNLEDEVLFFEQKLTLLK